MTSYNNLASEKIHDLLGMRTVMQGGGGALNRPFRGTGLCDKLARIVAATADGTLDMPAVFLSRGSLASGGQVGCNLTVAEARECGCA